MFWLTFRIIIYIIIFTGIWYGGSFYVAQKLITQLQQTSSHAIFVDKNISKSNFLSNNQNGAFAFPFATISSALQSAKEKNIDTIIIAPGIYEEKLELPENIILSAAHENVVIIKKETNSYTLKTNNNTKILNIDIFGARNTVIIPHNTSTTFINSMIANAHDFGIKMEKKKRPPILPGQNKSIVYEILEKTKDEISEIPLVRFNNVIIAKNDNQGMYLQDGRVEIINSKIIKNGEEGIDLHPHMFVTILNTNSSFNGESGLESEVYDNIVTIENSTFKNNIKSGVAFLTSLGTGNITLTNIKSINNAQFGMRCAVHKNRPAYPRPFFQSTVNWQDPNNIFENNLRRNIATECYTF
jgi:hypothetical protein